MKRFKISKKSVTSLILIVAVSLICWDFATSTDQLMAEGTYRYESEFDAITAPTVPVDIAVVPSDYSDLSSPVSRSNSLSYEQIEDMVRKAIDLQGGFYGVINQGDVVMLKPNIVEKNRPPEDATNTDVRVVKAAIKIIDEFCEGNVEIIVAEGSPRNDYDDPTSETSCWESSGYRDLLTDSYLDGITFSLFNLNQPYEDCIEYDLTVSNKGYAAPHNYKYKVHKKEKEVDVYISIPVLKIHDTGITSGLKNQIGTAPGAAYGYNKTGNKIVGSYSATGLVHDDYLPQRWTTEEIVDLCVLADIDFVIVDAIMCLHTEKTDNSYNRVRFNTIVAGYDPVAVDHVCAKIMSLNPDDVAHITLAEKAGLGTNDDASINVVGASIDDVKKIVDKNTTVNGKWGQSNRTWLLSKTYSATSVEDAALPNETSYEPVAGQDDWSEAVYFFDDQIDLYSFYGGPSSVVSYAFTYFDSPKDQTAELWLGFGEGIIVYLNGTEVYKFTSNATYGSGDLGTEKAFINIKKGENSLMVKTLNKQNAAYTFALNICENTTNSNLNGNRVDGLKFYTQKKQTSVPEIKNQSNYVLSIYPNPCISYANINFSSPKTIQGNIDIYDMNGKVVKSYKNHTFNSGINEVKWDLKGINGEKVNAGIYICVVRSGKYQSNQRILIK